MWQVIQNSEDGPPPTSLNLVDSCEVTGPPSPFMTSFNVSDHLYNVSTYNHMTNNLTNGTDILLKTLPFSLQVILIILYTLTTLAAVVGNSLAIIVFAKGKRSNADLRHFLLNLAVADLIMAIFCIPFTLAYQIAHTWFFSDFLCRVVQSCQVISVTASVSTNTAIGIDRLIAVKFPLHTRVTSSRSKLCILSIWIFALSLGIVPFVMSRTNQNDNGRMVCEEHFLNKDTQLIYGLTITSVNYVLPLIVLSVTYIMIGKLLWQHRLPGNADDHRDAVQIRSKRKVVKMLITIVLLFGICWFPLHLFTTIILTFRHNVFGDLADKVYFGVHWLSMANSFVNPMIYGFMSYNFRADLKSLAESWGCCCINQTHLKYRPAAVRRRPGCNNVHDFRRTSHPAQKWRLKADDHNQVSKRMLKNCNNKTTTRDGFESHINRPSTEYKEMVNLATCPIWTSRIQNEIE